MSTATTVDFEAWKLGIENKKAMLERMIERRRDLTPLENHALPQLQMVNDTPPYIEIGGITMSKIDWDFVKSATKKIGGVDVPAFAVYRLYGANNMCSVKINADGSAVYLTHGFEPSKPYLANSTDNMLQFDAGRLTDLRAALLRGEKISNDKPTVEQPKHKSFIAGKTLGLVGCSVALFAVAVGAYSLSAVLGLLIGMVATTLLGMTMLIELINMAMTTEQPGRTNFGREQRQLRAARGRGETEELVVITHEFKGIIPEKTRLKLRMIKAAIEQNARHVGERRGRYFGTPHDMNLENILLVEEAYNWSGSAVVTRNEDPLIVYKDWRGYYLVDAFDVSPLEDFLLKEAMG